MLDFIPSMHITPSLKISPAVHLGQQFAFPYSTQSAQLPINPPFLSSILPIFLMPKIRRVFLGYS